MLSDREMAKIKVEITEHKKTVEDLQRTAEKLRKFFNGMVKTIGLIIKKRDPYTAGHEIRVAHLSCAIAKEMNFSQSRV